jgi:hypothetical protein
VTQEMSEERLRDLFTVGKETIFNVSIIDVLKNDTAKFEKAVNPKLDYKHDDKNFSMLMTVFQYLVLAHEAIKMNLPAAS